MYTQLTSFTTNIVICILDKNKAILKNKVIKNSKKKPTTRARPSHTKLIPTKTNTPKIIGNTKGIKIKFAKGLIKLTSEKVYAK